MTPQPFAFSKLTSKGTNHVASVNRQSHFVRDRVNSLAAQEEKEKAEEKVNPQAILRQAIQKANQGNFPESIKLIEKAVKAAPKMGRARYLAAQIYQVYGTRTANKKGKESKAKAHKAYLASAKHFRAFMKTEDGKRFGGRVKSYAAVVYYNEACAHASGGKPEKAMASLSEALKSGFSDTGLLESDKDLEPLRKLAKFKSLIPKYVKQIKARFRKQAETALAKNKPFPFNFTLDDLKGKPVALKQFRGKVVIVDFWGTWCPPCRKEIPHFIALNKKYKKKGLAIVGINYERGAKSTWKGKIESFIAKNGVNYPCLMGDRATSAQVKLRGYPTTLFIDRKGVVRLKLVGYQAMPKLESIVEALLKEGAK